MQTSHSNKKQTIKDRTEMLLPTFPNFIIYIFTAKHGFSVRIASISFLRYARGREPILHTQHEVNKGSGVKTQGLHLHSDSSANL